MKITTSKISLQFKLKRHRTTHYSLINSISSLLYSNSRLATTASPQVWG